MTAIKFTHQLPVRGSTAAYHCFIYILQLFYVFCFHSETSRGPQFVRLCLPREAPCESDPTTGERTPQTHRFAQPRSRRALVSTTVQCRGEWNFICWKLSASSKACRWRSVIPVYLRCSFLLFQICKGSSQAIAPFPNVLVHPAELSFRVDCKTVSTSPLYVECSKWVFLLGLGLVW